MEVWKEKVINAIVIRNYMTLSITFANLWIPTITELTLEEVETIGSNTFKNFASLSTITFNPNLTSIGNNAFDGCGSLTKIIFAWGSPMTQFTIGTDAFLNCFSLGEFEFPSQCESYTVGATCLKNTGIASIIIPENMTTIMNGMFSMCRKLSNVDLVGGKITSIGDNAFWSRTALTSIALPVNLTSLGSYAFENCFALKNVSLNAKIQVVNT